MSTVCGANIASTSVEPCERTKGRTRRRTSLCPAFGILGITWTVGWMPGRSKTPHDTSTHIPSLARSILEYLVLKSHLIHLTCHLSHTRRSASLEWRLNSNSTRRVVPRNTSLNFPSIHPRLVQGFKSGPAIPPIPPSQCQGFPRRVRQSA